MFGYKALSQNITNSPLFTNETFTKSINVTLHVETVAASGFAGSLTGGLINKERGKELWTKVALGTGIGAVVGGVVEGVKASVDGRNFWDGSKVTNTTVIIDQPIPAITQAGDNNCLPASGAAVDQSLGGGLTQETARGWFPGTSAQDDPINPKVFWKKFTEETGRQTKVGVGSPERAKAIADAMQKGYRVNFGMVESNAKVGHSYVMGKITSTTRLKVNGISTTKLSYSAMNPYNGSFNTFSFNQIASANSITFINPF